ncbi:hypothetical protein SAMN05421767_102109 [Granulicatella balaenopterae]|uniref:Uncharacterized protein n=1 Tax=Granulicatella balaenopterae TaxID=137733 RepID=A0A1H9HIB5_9LACT|nr:hypothetical protein [Granulicatella balaenopterae]SEQ62065.1 hypothetical protein SAMN05421767_102109 [Granulicatella balaenopterae]
MKKHIKVILIVIACGLIGSTNFALANNHSDESWSFSYKIGTGNTHYTSSRNKLDDSYAYVKLDSVSNNGSVDCWCVTHGKKDIIDSSVVTVNVGQERFISQYAYEKGYKKIRLAVKSTMWWGRATGVWSPDSV